MTEQPPEEFVQDDDAEGPDVPDLNDLPDNEPDDKVLRTSRWRVRSWLSSRILKTEQARGVGMVFRAAIVARNAENDRTNVPGMCLVQCRTWADIPARYGDAITAWLNTNQRFPGDRKPPRGSFVFWSGGSHGHGHIAVSLGNGKIRTTDVPRSGLVTTVDLEWIERNWHLRYAGWAWDVNEGDCTARLVG